MNVVVVTLLATVVVCSQASASARSRWIATPAYDDRAADAAVIAVIAFIALELWLVLNMAGNFSPGFTKVKTLSAFFVLT